MTMTMIIMVVFNGDNEDNGAVDADDEKDETGIVDKCGSRGRDRGSGPPLENYKNIEFLSKTGLGPLEDHKATKPAFNVGPSSAR